MGAHLCFMHQKANILHEEDDNQLKKMIIYSSRNSNLRFILKKVSKIQQMMQS